MRYVIRVGLAALATAAAPLATQAADVRVRPVYKAPPPPPVAIFNWSGCYVGGQIGSQRSRWTADVSYPATAPQVVAARDFDGDGRFLYGGQIGCNFQPAGGVFVLGVEGDLAGTSGNHFNGELYRFPGTVNHFDATGKLGSRNQLAPARRPRLRSFPALCGRRRHLDAAVGFARRRDRRRRLAWKRRPATRAAAGISASAANMPSATTGRSGSNIATPITARSTTAFQPGSFRSPLQPSPRAPTTSAPRISGSGSTTCLGPARSGDTDSGGRSRQS